MLVAFCEGVVLRTRRESASACGCLRVYNKNEKRSSE